MSVARVNAGPISIRVNGAEYTIDQLSVSWLHQQIDGRRRAGEPVCVVISAHTDSVNITLATPDCGSGPGGNRPPNQTESEIFARWHGLVLDKGNFTAGNLWAFLQYLGRVV